MYIKEIRDFIERHFDAPSREFCVTRRIRTNTPLQALVTLNDPVFSEAAGMLAERMLHEITGSGTDVDLSLRLGYRLALASEPDSETMQTLRKLYDDACAYYNENHQAAFAMVGSDTPVCVELAAMKVVANGIMNLDQFVTKG